MPNADTGIIQISGTTNLATTKYISDYLEEAEKRRVFGQFVQWEPPIPDEGGDGAAATYDIPWLNDPEPVTTELTETDDLPVVSFGQSNVTITPKEYGASMGLTQKLKFQSRVKIESAMAKKVARLQVASHDRLLRDAMLACTQVLRPNGLAARTSLDATNDLLTEDFLSEVKVRCQNLGMEPWDGKNYLIIHNPVLTPDIVQMPTVKDLAVYGGQVDTILNGEYAKSLLGFRFVEHPWGKIYLSGGTVAQTATTTAGTTSANGTALAAGATTVTVADATGLAVGDWITIGALESATAEQVQITGVSSATLTIRGLGMGPASFGCRYAHDNGVAVTEAANVAGLMVVGRGSVLGKYGARTGQFGQPIVVPGGDRGRRFFWHSYYWYGGYGLVQRYIMRLEVAVRKGWFGSN